MQRPFDVVKAPNTSTKVLDGRMIETWRDLRRERMEGMLEMKLKSSGKI